ncbi:hypothetical protein SLE2022_261960 [Rubroshorea leprosula]
MQPPSVRRNAGVMVSFTAALISPPFLTHFDSPVSPSCLCAVGPWGGVGKGRNFLPLKLSVALGEESRGGFSFLGFIEVKRRRRRRRRRGSGYSCWCKKECDSEGDLALEAEILKFMKDSEKPEVFPSKKELVDAGRMDLVEGIQRQGGWLALGWDLDNGCDSQEEQEQQYQFQENGFQHLNFHQTENAWNNGDLKNSVDGEVRSSRASSCSPSSSGRTLEEVAAEDGRGIEDILSRLEKERNINFGFGFNEKEISARFPSNDHKDDFLPQQSTTIVAGPERRRSISNTSRGIIDDSGGKISHNQSFLGVDDLRHGSSIKSDIWRNWSIQRAGPSDMEFEDISGDDTLEIRARSSELDRRNESNSFQNDNPDQIHSHLERLELELSSVLQSLRSDADNISLQEDDRSSKDNLQNLSDALEFQQNEVLTAQGKLRSIRAKLAVLEGKMALSIIDTQKIVEQKQRRIDDARRASQLLRTAYIVWPNSASEVLLAGSFDGWATQRKMERSRTGVFSLYLKLYPGRYEIKFIVDGKWMIDPFRPIVHNGHENNLLIIT